MRQTALALAGLLLLTAARGGGDPLHVRIDKAIESAHVGPSAAPADDATFLRRVTLDLTGTIPSAKETRAFLADKTPDKRARVVDRLLASRAAARHLASTFDVMLMERRRDKYVKADPWRKYLVDSFVANKPYDALVREILGADGVDPKMHAAAKFHLEREVEPNALTRDVGRMFFGMDLQCAQCHDHPRIDDYLQRDYYGLYAFLNRVYLFRPDNKKPAVLAEKGEGDVAFKSVFTKAEGKTRPRLPGGVEISEPTFKKGEEYTVKPDKKKKTVRPVPKYSRLAQLARHSTDGKNRAFNRNIANRLWAHMMGRGLVEPVDLHHSKNPPAHPELMDTLADAFASMKYDIRGFLRELALSHTYQRSFEMPAELAREAKAAARRLEALNAETEKLERAAEAARDAVDAASAALAKAAKRLTALETEGADPSHDRGAVLKAVKQAADLSAAAAAKLPEDKELAEAARTFAAKVSELREQLEARKAKVARAESEFEALEVKREAAIARKKAEAVAARHAARRADAAEALVAYGRVAADREKRDAALRDLTDLWAGSFALGAFEPLTPEQLCASIMEATGQTALLRAAGESDYEKKNKSENKTDEARALHAEQYVQGKVRSSAASFVSLYGAGAGQPQDGFSATADQALFMANGGNVRGWLAPSRGSLTDRLNKMKDPKAIADEVYLSILTRPPSDQETEEVVRHLAERPKNKLEAVQEIAWALLSSVEFRFRH